MTSPIKRKTNPWNRSKIIALLLTFMILISSIIPSTGFAFSANTDNATENDITTEYIEGFSQSNAGETAIDSMQPEVFEANNASVLYTVAAPPRRKDNELIIKYRHSESSQEINRRLTERLRSSGRARNPRLHVEKIADELNIAIVTIESGLEAKEALDIIKSDSLVEYIQQDYLLYGFTIWNTEDNLPGDNPSGNIPEDDSDSNPGNDLNFDLNDDIDDPEKETPSVNGEEDEDIEDTNKPLDSDIQGLQWALENYGQVISGIQGVAGVDIRHKLAIAAGYSYTDVIVAVLDTGIDVYHESLRGKMLPGYDFVNILDFHENKLT